jgi:hypothetical protein
VAAVEKTAVGVVAAAATVSYSPLESPSGKEAYARFNRSVEEPYRDGNLPSWATD